MPSISVSRVRIRQVSISLAEVSNPRVGVIMGSDSDLPTMQGAIDVLVDFGVPHEVRIVSAHRTPDVMADYARSAAERGLAVIIAGAGGAAHLPGMTASMTSLPVIGVPVALQHLSGLDSLLSIVQMPAGIPVATVAVGNARNAGLLAVRILATSDTKLREAMERYQADLGQVVQEKDAKLREQFGDPS
jgi:5-(carboxyamino)imidazole ribonucleotide mutase